MIHRLSKMCEIEETLLTKSEIDLKLMDINERVNFSLQSKSSEKSKVWDKFDIIIYKGVLQNFARCKKCKLILVYKSKNGTASLLRHNCSTKNKLTKKITKLSDDFYDNGLTSHLFTIDDELIILQEVMKRNPFDDNTKWKDISSTLYKVNGKDYLDYLIKEYVEHLIKNWQTCSAMERSGTKEQNVKKETLLKKVCDIHMKYLCKNDEDTCNLSNEYGKELKFLAEYDEGKQFKLDLLEEGDGDHIPNITYKINELALKKNETVVTPINNCITSTIREKPRKFRNKWFQRVFYLKERHKLYRKRLELEERKLQLEERRLNLEEEKFKLVKFEKQQKLTTELKEKEQAFERQKELINMLINDKLKNFMK